MYQKHTKRKFSSMIAHKGFVSVLLMKKDIVPNTFPGDAVCNKNVIDHYGCCSMPRLELRRLAAVSLNYSLPAYFTIHMHLRYSKSLLYLLRRVIYISIKHSILQTLFICRLSNLTDPRPLNLGLCNKARCLDPVNTQVVGAAFRKRILIFLSSTPPTTAEI